MIRSQIVVPNQSDGKPLHVPVEFRSGVELANRLLETELLPNQQFDVNATWRFIQPAQDRVSVLLDLTSVCDGNPVGITGYPMDADAFVDETRIKAGLNRPIWNFSSLLSYISKVEMKHSFDRIRSTILAG